MKLYFFLIISLLLFIGCSKDKNQNYLSENNLKGNVHTIKIFKYEVIEKFGEILKGDLYYSGNQSQEINKKGLIIEKNHFDSDGSLFSKFKYNYNYK